MLILRVFLFIHMGDTFEEAPKLGAKVMGRLRRNNDEMKIFEGVFCVYLLYGLFLFKHSILYRLGAVAYT